jgi:beta-N-acetylhexosaminidase
MYNRCFPAYQTEAEDFFAAVRPEEAHIISAYENGEMEGFAQGKGESGMQGKMVGFALLHGNAITLLCVDEGFRRRGHGSALLEQAEGYIKKSGADRIVLGHGEHYILQGVPMAENDTAVTFFKKRGYKANWESANMRLDLAGFDKNKLNIPPQPATVTFRFADYTNETEKAALLSAVHDTDVSWHSFFADTDDHVMLAVENNKIVGMQILEPAGGLFLPNDKVGVIACVGTVPSARQRGIGLRLVAEGAQWLKEQGCEAAELLYVGLEAWYGRVGFVSTGKQWMGEKIL